jgi:formylglycine-generating enzyme required for sulfatase activity
VEQVAWDDVQEFCSKVTALSRQTVRLPTEAEWEYACRAGSGDASGDLNLVAWGNWNSKSTQPVGQKEPNAFGLNDMLGNVAQLCQDWYDGRTYQDSPAEDPEGPAQGSVFHVLRGFSYNTISYDYLPCRRSFAADSMTSEANGFRVVMPASRTK